MCKPGPKRYAWDHPKIVARFKARCTRCKCGCLLFDNDNGQGWARFRANDFPGCPTDRVQAHRYAWAVAFGEIEADHDVHHKHGICNHRNCVDADHLESVHHTAHALISNEHRWAEDTDAFENAADFDLP